MNKKQYCSNCNKYGHISKNCPEPITSVFVICIQITNDLSNIILNNNMNLSNSDIFSFNYKRLSNLDKINLYKNKVKFLLVQRKHSLNYINFVRGIYDENNFEELERIFSFMSKEEIEEISNNNFSYLWQKLWDKTAKKNISKRIY